MVANHPDVDAQTVFFGVLLAVFAYLVVRILQPFLTYLLATLLLAFVLAPVQRRLEPHVGASLSAVTAIVGALAGIGAVVALLATSLPADASSVSRMIGNSAARRRIERQLERLFGVDVSLQQSLSNLPQRVSEFVVGDISNLASAATHAFLGVVLLLFLLYYLLKDRDRLLNWVETMTPLEPAVREELRTEMYETTWAVLKGHVFVAILQGFVAGIGLLVAGIPHVLFWTVVMMLLELFPVVGVAAVLGPAVLYLVIVDRLFMAVFLLVYGLTAVALVDDYVRALVIDRGSSLHSGTILVGVFGGVYVFGVMGLFYGPIVLGIFKTLVQVFNENYVSDG